MQEYKKNLDALSSAVLRAYLDSVMFVIIVPIANDKRKTNNFLFDYSYLNRREVILCMRDIKILSDCRQITIPKEWLDSNHIKVLKNNES